KDDWDLRHHDGAAKAGWDELCQRARGPTLEAWNILRRDPRNRTNPQRQHRLRDDLATRWINGKQLEQWQYEIAGAARIWYCPDDETRTVYVTKATWGHP